MNVAVCKSPYNKSVTIKVIRSVLTELDGEYKSNVGKWRATDYHTLCPIKARFFYQEETDGTAIRVVFDNHKTYYRRFWKSFVNILVSKEGEKFGINARLPYEPVVVLKLENEQEQIFTSQTKGGTSLAGFLLGGLAFGTPGAIVGGLSGTERTNGKITTYDTKYASVRIIWNDGCIIESRIKKKSNLYNQIIMMK